MRIHHVAYAVSDIERSADFFANLGYTREGESCDDEKRGVRILFLRSEDGVRVELVEPLRDGSPVSAQLEGSHGASTPYHICYEVENIKVALDDLIGLGGMPVSGIGPAPAIEGRNVCFVFGKNFGLIELVEETGNRH